MLKKERKVRKNFLVWQW